MNQLIPLQPQTINGNAVETVSARTLHEFLGVTERFSSWMERQFQYGFEENVDYLGCKVFNTLAKQEVRVCGKSRLCSLPQKNGSEQCYYD